MDDCVFHHGSSVFGWSSWVPFNGQWRIARLCKKADDSSQRSRRIRSFARAKILIIVLKLFFSSFYLSFSRRLENKNVLFFSTVFFSIIHGVLWTSIIDIDMVSGCQQKSVNITFFYWPVSLFDQILKKKIFYWKNFTHYKNQLICPLRWCDMFLFC